MKLLWCPACRDVRKLRRFSSGKTVCGCGFSYGWYKEDGLYAVVGGKGQLIGLANPDLYEALRRPDHNTLRCWLMVNSPRVKRDKTQGVG